MAYPEFKPAQANAIKTLNKRYMEQERSKGRRKWLGFAWELAQKFGSRTTIHGVNRLLGVGIGPYERFIWLLTVVSALLGSIYVCLILSKRFTEGNFETIVDSTRMPVYRIYFPVITICNMNRLNWERLEQAQARYLPKNATALEHELFARVVSTYDDIKFGNFDKFGVLKNEPLELLNGVNFSLVFDFMTWRCEEFFTDCVWRHFPMNCCEIFSKRRSKNGLCWAFNTLETEEGRRMQRLDPKWPWRTGSAGPSSALTAKVLINPEKHFPNRTNDKGLIVMVTEPNVWHHDAFDVPENTQTMLEIEPVIYFYDNNTRSIPSEQRQCVFDDERNSGDFKSLHGYIYMIENCQSECHQEYLMRYCNCSMDLLFPPGQFPACQAKDLLCLSKNNEYFLYSHQPGEEQYVRNNFDGMECKCFRNCYSLNYVTDVRPSFLPAEVRGNVSYVDLDVHFRFETLMVYRTSLIFGWVDLMVAFGGIAGLFLGCSLISGMELAYFALIEIPTFVIDKLKQQWRQRTPDIIVVKSTQKFGISNRILAVQQHNQGHFVINGNAERLMVHTGRQHMEHNLWQPTKLKPQQMQAN